MAARLGGGLADRLNRNSAHRLLLEKTLGIHRDKLLPTFAPRTFEAWAMDAGLTKGAPGAEVVLFQSCYVDNNEPGDRPRHRRGAARERRRRPLRPRPRVLRHARLGVRRPARAAPARAAQPGRAGSPRRGRQHDRRARTDLRADAAPRVSDAGRARPIESARSKLAAAVRDPGEYLASIRGRAGGRAHACVAPRAGRVSPGLPPARAGDRLSGARSAPPRRRRRHRLGRRVLRARRHATR